MKFYLAARYSLNPLMRTYRAHLEAIGHSVTARWINGGHELKFEWPTEEREKLRSLWAREDYEDLLAAEAVISFTEEPGKAPGRNRGGRHVEFGIGLALGLRLIVVGYRENVFHGLPQVEFYPDWKSALEAISLEAAYVPARGD